MKKERRWAGKARTVPIGATNSDTITYRKYCVMSLIKNDVPIKCRLRYTIILLSHDMIIKTIP